MAHAFNPHAQETEIGETVSSRPAWSKRASSKTARSITWRNPVSKTKKTTKKSDSEEENPGLD